MFDRVDKGTPDSCQISQMLVQEATATALIVAWSKSNTVS
jgi:hypothetical protein